jgi:hypothetical protein
LIRDGSRTLYLDRYAELGDLSSAPHWSPRR